MWNTHDKSAFISWLLPSLKDWNDYKGLYFIYLFQVIVPLDEVMMGNWCWNEAQQAESVQWDAWLWTVCYMVLTFEKKEITQ